MSCFNFHFLKAGTPAVRSAVPPVRAVNRGGSLGRSATAAQVEAAAIDALSDAGSEAQRDAARAAHAQIRGARRPMAQV